MRLPISLLILLALLAPVPASAGPEGQMTLVLNISTAARWFDPSESEGLITPFIFYFMIHDALVKPLPGNPMAPSLAESWSASADGLTYDFVLRNGVRFQNGEPVTSEDVKFSFERYKGASAKLLKERVAAVEIVDPHRVRFHLKGLARFHDVLWHSSGGGGLDRPEEVRGEGRRRRVQASTGRRRAL